MAALFWQFIVTFYVLLRVNNSSRGEWGQIKINEPRASYSSNNNNNYNNNNNNNNYNNNNNNNAAASASASYRDPHSETENNEIVATSVIEYLSSRKGETVEGKHDKYTYKVFLFEKVEQSENWYSWNLGIFDKWEYCDAAQTQLCLQYTDGQVCGNGMGRSAHIHIICGESIGDKDPTKEHLFDITEPSTCSYHINMYIPQICQLVDNNINHLFAANNHNNDAGDAQTQTQIQTGDTSDLMDKLNEIMDKENGNKELDNLWKLCLMSLMVDDEGKLNKIKKVANMFMLESKPDNDEDDSEQTGVCDFYLQQMLENNIKPTEPPLPPNNNEDVGGMISETTVDENVIYDGDNNAEIDGKMGGLIGAILSDDDDDNTKDENNDVDINDNVVPNEFQGDKIVFQSGSNPENHQNDIIEQDLIV